MSIQAVSWVLENSTTKKLERLVLIALANHADEYGECWPSVERIAKEAGTTPTQARRVLGTLEDGGHIVRSINAAPDSRMRSDRRTNLYRLVLSGGTQSDSPSPERARVERADGGTPSARTGARSTTERATAERAPNHQGTITESSEEPSPSLVLLDAAFGAAPKRTAEQKQNEFETFWVVYPRKTAKEPARAAFERARKKATFETIIEGARRFSDDPNRVDQFTPHATTWLNQARWSDPPLPPRTGIAPSRAQEREGRTAQAIASVFGAPGSQREIGR
jgi:DNA-binding MarR family transcriptional regulator